MAAKASRTAETWRERVLAQQASGQSVRGWCRANNLPEHGFYWWRANLGLSPAPKRKHRRVCKPPSVGFARVVVDHVEHVDHVDHVEHVQPPASARAAEPLRLLLAGGRELMLPASMPVEQIARIVHAIEGAA